jgi:hypothetical protein
MLQTTPVLQLQLFSHQSAQLAASGPLDTGVIQTPNHVAL